MDSSQSRRNELAEKIKSFHGELRLKCRKGEEDWTRHAESRKDSEDEYSKWMKELGSYWNQEERTRWIREAIRKYYGENHRERFAEKLRKKVGEEERKGSLGPPDSKRIQILDVGSCYNPFKDADPDWEILPIDLKSSSLDGVYECDFLNVSLSPFLGLNERVIEYLPENYFDALLFALFLEYLPLPSLRLQALAQASRVLKPKGLLIIITPDSSHPGKNVTQMKAWRACLSLYGFIRVYYEKLPHIHCIAYAKIEESPKTLSFCRELSKKLKMEIGMEDASAEELLFIPPDKTTTKELLESEKRDKDVVEVEEERIYSFEDFPDFEM